MLRGGPEVIGDELDNDCDEAVDCDDPDLDDLVGPPAASAGPAFCEGWCARAVTGDLLVEETAFVNLESLSCLTRVGGMLRIAENPALTSLDGLQNLTVVDGDLAVSGNPVLASLDGLQSLAEVGMTSGSATTAC